MSVTSNAEHKLSDNLDGLFELMTSIGVDISDLDIDNAKAKRIKENGKKCKKRWQQQHPEKMKEYKQKYYASEKGQALKKRLAEHEKTPEMRAKRKAYRERSEVKEHIREYKKEYAEKNKERIKKRNAEYIAKNKDEINAKHRDYYAKNKDRIKARRKELLEQKKQLQSEVSE